MLAAKVEKNIASSSRRAQHESVGPALRAEQSQKGTPASCFTEGYNIKVGITDIRHREYPLSSVKNSLLSPLSSQLPTKRRRESSGKLKKGNFEDLHVEVLELEKEKLIMEKEKLQLEIKLLERSCKSTKDVACQCNLYLDSSSDFYDSKYAYVPKFYFYIITCIQLSASCFS